MAKSILIGICAACSLTGGLAGQLAPKELATEVRFGSFRIDGDLTDWQRSKIPSAWKLEDRSKVWRESERRRWGGRDDLSAEFWLAHDREHLYLAGWVRDDDNLPPDPNSSQPNDGDSIEVFLDLQRSAASEAGAALPRKLGEKDVQLFVMPRSGNWARKPWIEGRDRVDELSGGEFSGMKLEAKVAPDGRSYTFELRIALHNFRPNSTEPLEALGFHLAINDRDRKIEGAHYMSLDGENPTEGVQRFKLLRLQQPPMPSEGLGLWSRSADLGWWGLFGCLLLIAVLLFSRRVPLVDLPPIRARLARVLGVVFLLLGLFLPGLLEDHQSNAYDQQLRTVATTLESEVVRKLENGTLKSYVGDTRDQPLLDLLQGRPIKRRQFLTHQFLSEIAPGRFGAAPLPYPNDYFLVRPYWIPLPVDQPQSFSFRRALVKGRVLQIVVARPIRSAFALDEAPSVKIAYRLRGESEHEEPKPLPPPGPMKPCRGFDVSKSNREMGLFASKVPGAAVGLSLTGLVEDGLELVGITVLSDVDEEPGSGGTGATENHPLVLGEALGGVESDLWGIHPLDAGITLRDRGDSRLVAIPGGRRRVAHRLSLVYQATYPGSLIPPDVQEGDEVCRVTIQFSAGKDRVISLEHQRTMFYELGSRNRDVPEGVPVEQVSVGEDVDGDRLINVVYSLPLELDRGVTVKSLRFTNTGPYPIRFRSVIFGHEQSAAPSEGPDSPVIVGADGKVSLKPKYVDLARGIGFAIYRADSVKASSLVGSMREARADIPASVRAQRKTDPQKTWGSIVDEDDTRTFGRYLPLHGTGTDVVLGMWSQDPGHGARQRLIAMLGVLLCLVSAPFLLLLFNDALGWLSNLRLRLMAMVSVATLVPLAVLFIVLVRALEKGHEDDLQGAMVSAVRTASDQLRERQNELRESVHRWVALLGQQEKDFVASSKALAGGADAAARSTALAELKSQLATTMKNQLLWKGGFMRLAYTPAAGAPSWLQPFYLLVGDQRMESATLRDDPGIPPVWIKPIIGVRSTEGPISLSVVRPLDADFLENISPGRAAVLCDARNGYEEVRSANHPASRARDTQVLIADRVTVSDAARDTGQPVFRRHKLGGGDWVAAYDVLRDLQGTPRAIVGVMDEYRPATLSLAVGDVPVRSFFVVMAGLLLVLTMALASVVTTRITGPIERLEKGAESLRRGEFDVRIEHQERGQIGRLTETFNNMAQDLRGRIQDLNHLNRGIQELTSRLDLDQVLASAMAFFARHSSADRVRVLLMDRERDLVEVYGDGRVEVDRQDEDVATLLAATGSMSLRLREGTALARLFGDHRCLLALPLILAGRPRGSILLLFESAVPAPLNLELLSTIAAQTTAALENARLYRHAVEDLYTGAYVPDYFSRLVGHAVAGAQEDGRVLSLLGVRLLCGGQREQSLGVEGFGHFMERVARAIRASVSADAKLCRLSPDTFQVLVPNVDARRAENMVAEVEGRLVDPELDLRFADLRVRAVTFPSEGASAEFLFHALDSKLLASPVDAMEATGQLEAEEGIVLSSPAIGEVVRILQKVAPSDLTILLTGETGTGKELVANLVHKWSKRARGPLVKVHCAALSESLLQSELFGHEKGAFTGATVRKAGKFEQAEGGTVFLDEIGEVSLDTQVKLLRVLQEREVDLVGGLQPVPVDVRIVAATNRNIEQMVADGSFREDLYYRLQGMVVTVPPLRERKTEIPALLEVFRREAVAAGHTSVTGFSTDAMDELFRRSWPGNIRELRNAAFRAMVLAGEGLMERSHLLGILPKPAKAQPSPQPRPSPAESTAEPTVLVPRAVPQPQNAKSEELSGRLAELLRLVRGRDSLSAQEYAEAAEVSPRTSLRDLNELLDRGLIERIGRRRGARYRVPLAKAPDSAGE